MSRKPVDKQQPTECRQAVWEEIKIYADELFSIPQIAKGVRLEESSVREYITGLLNAGYLSRTAAPFSAIQFLFTLIKDTGVDAPRVRKDGSPVTQGAGRQQMWNTMPVLKEFTPVDLAFNSSTELHSVATAEAKTYCAALCAAGYLVGRANGRFALIPSRWSGPHPPQIQRTKQVYDPNLKKVVWSKIERGAE